MSGRVADPRSSRAPATRRIAQAVQQGIDIALQPIVDLASGEVVGVEALARFSDGRSPDKWFADAAAVGLGAALELAAVHAALARIDELPPTASINVNVSAATACTDELAAMLAGSLARRVILEITEHVRVADYAALVTALTRLRARGVRLAIDDAGAGFASLQHVLELKPDVVKLDASLVRGMDSKAEHRALVSAMVSFAKQTSCSLIAEGIETAGELEAAREVGVGCAQGFHLGMPHAAGPERWQVDLPRRPHLRLKASVRGARGFVRPAAIFLAAAMSWQGVVAVAGVQGSRAGSSAETPPAVAAPESGVSGASASDEPPATARPSVAKPTARKVDASRLPAAQPSLSRAAPSSTGSEGPVADVVRTVNDVTSSVTETVTDVTVGLTETVGHTVGGLLRGLLGG